MRRSDGLDQIIHHLTSRLVASLFNLLHFGLGVLVCIVFGFLVCCGIRQLLGLLPRIVSNPTHLGFKLLELFFLLSPVLLDLFLGFGFGVFYSFRPVLNRSDCMFRKGLSEAYILWLRSS
jgi:hypothetical protein